MLLLSILLARSAPANELPKVVWHRDAQTAWKATRERGRPLLVFVTKDDCYYCKEMKNRTLADATVAGTINSSFVPLVLDGSSNSPLLKELNVTAYPCTFVISPKAVVLDRMVGYVPPAELSGRLNSLRPQVPVAKVPDDP